MNNRMWSQALTFWLVVFVGASLGTLVAGLSGCTIEYPTRTRYIYQPNDDSDDPDPDDPDSDDPNNDDPDPDDPDQDDPPNHEVTVFHDDGSAEAVDLGYEVRRPNQGVATITQGWSTRTLTRQGNSGLGLSRMIPTTLNQLHVSFQVQLIAEYQNPEMASFADDFPLATTEVAFYDRAGNYRGTYFYYARATHPREASPPPYRVTPPEALFSRRQIGHRLASGSRLTVDLDLWEIARTRFDPGDLQPADVAKIELVFSCQDVWGRGDECYERIVIDDVRVYRTR